MASAFESRWFLIVFIPAPFEHVILVISVINVIIAAKNKASHSVPAGDIVVGIMPGAVAPTCNAPFRTRNVETVSPKKSMTCCQGI